MSLPQFKQTEVGIIPQHWGVMPMEDLFTFSGGLAASRDDLSSEGHCYLHYGDIHKSEKTFINVQQESATIPKLDTPLGDVSPKALLETGDVVFADASEDIEGVGKHIVVLNEENSPFISGLHTIVAKSKNLDLDTAYKKFCFQSENIRRQFSFYAVGAKVSSISRSNIAKLLLPLPPLPEQREIARILGVWDDAISAMAQLIADKMQFKRALMQQLLTGERRFAEFVRSDETQKTPCGVLPRDWPLSKLSDVFQVVQRRNRGATERVLTASGQHGMVDQRTYFNRSVSGASIAEYYLLKEGEFAYNRSSMKGYPFGAIKRLDAHNEGALSTLYLCFALNRSDCDSDFWAHFFEGGLLNGQLRGIAQMGARSHGLLNVTNSDFFAAIVPLPTLEEQRRIADTLDAATHEIGLLGEQLDALKTQKRGLMQRLLSGELPVAGAATGNLEGDGFSDTGGES